MLILFFIILAIVCVLMAVYLSPKENPTYTPEEKPDTYQDKAQPGQGVIRNIHTRINARSDAKTQHTANVATSIATEGIRSGTEAISAKLEKEALPERHEQTLAREEAETDTHIAVQEAIQGEADLRKELAAAASERLLTIEDLSAVNKHGYMKEIDLRVRQGEIQQDLDAADRYELTQHELINKLTAHHGQLIKERRRIELEEDDEYVKQRLLERHDKNISVVEQLIDGRQTRLLLSENGQETRGSQTEDTESGADSQEAPETDN